MAFVYNIRPKYIIDTLSLARHIDSRNRNDLKHLAPRLKIGEKGDNSWAMGLTWEQMTEEQRKQLAEYACNDAELAYKAFEKLLPLLSWPEVELPLIQHTLELYTQPQLRVDYERAGSLVKAMQAKVKDAAGEICMTVGELRQNKQDGPFFTALQFSLGSDKMPMKRGKNKLIPALGKDDDGLKKLRDHTNPEVKKLVEARLAVKSWPLHIKRVQSVVAQSKAMNGLLPIPLRYYGGHTGRWSGTEGINPHNFGAHSKEDLINQVRTILIAPFDHVLVVTDAAQIEARIVNWLADQYNILKQYETGDPYSALASKIVGKEIAKPMKERQLGKIGELGCGFGMGATKLQINAKKPPYEIDVSATVAEKIVQIYRETHPLVVKLWYNVDRAFKYVTKYPLEKFTLPVGTDSQLVFTNVDGIVCIRLPSSRVLYYPKVKMRVENSREELVQLNATDNRKSVRLWGGYLVENIVQSVARDILALAILETDKYGAAIGQRVALTVHDEIVSVAPKVNAAMALEIQLAALRNRPAWAKSLPLDAEGTISERYSK